jgi:hypothetical protein
LAGPNREALSCVPLAPFGFTGSAPPARAELEWLIFETGERTRPEVKTKKCTIVDKKPASTETTVVGGDGVVYKTRTEAENAMKTVKACTTQ